MSSLRRRCDRDASLRARSIEAWPVMNDLTGAVICRETRAWIWGSSWRTTFVSERSTETTIIAAVGVARRPALALPASQAERTRVCGRRASAATSRGPCRFSCALGPSSRMGISWVGPNVALASFCARADWVPGTTVTDGDRVCETPSPIRLRTMASASHPVSATAGRRIENLANEIIPVCSSRLKISRCG